MDKDIERFAKESHHFLSFKAGYNKALEDYKKRYCCCKIYTKVNYKCGVCTAIEELAEPQKNEEVKD